MKWEHKLGFTYLISTSTVFSIIFFGTMLQTKRVATIYFDVFGEAFIEFLMLTSLLPFAIITIKDSFKGNLVKGGANERDNPKYNISPSRAGTNKTE